ASTCGFLVLNFGPLRLTRCTLTCGTEAPICYATLVPIVTLNPDGNIFLPLPHIIQSNLTTVIKCLALDAFFMAHGSSVRKYTLKIVLISRRLHLVTLTSKALNISDR